MICHMMPITESLHPLHPLQGRIQGGHRGQMTPPFQSVLILKQVLKIIILIGAKIIIDLLYYKAQELARLCLGIHIQTMH